MYFLTARNFVWTKTMKIIVIKNMDNHLHPKMILYYLYSKQITFHTNTNDHIG